MKLYESHENLFAARVELRENHENMFVAPAGLIHKVVESYELNRNGAGKTFRGAELHEQKTHTHNLHKALANPCVPTRTKTQKHFCGAFVGGHENPKQCSGFPGAHASAIIFMHKKTQ